jgi:hypothetical protein
MSTYISPYVSIRQNTSAYVSIRQHTSAYVSIRQHTSTYFQIAPWLLHEHLYICIYCVCVCVCVCIFRSLPDSCMSTYISPYVSIRQHTSAYVSICQLTSAYFQIAPWLLHEHLYIYMYIYIVCVCVCVCAFSDRFLTRAWAPTYHHTSACVSICQHILAYFQMAPCPDSCMSTCI